MVMMYHWFLISKVQTLYHRVYSWAQGKDGYHVLLVSYFRSTDFVP